MEPTKPVGTPHSDIEVIHYVGGADRDIFSAEPPKALEEGTTAKQVEEHIEILEKAAPDSTVLQSIARYGGMGLGYGLRGVACAVAATGGFAAAATLTPLARVIDLVEPALPFPELIEPARDFLLEEAAAKVGFYAAYPVSCAAAGIMAYADNKNYQELMAKEKTFNESAAKVGGVVGAIPGNVATVPTYVLVAPLALVAMPASPWLWKQPSHNEMEMLFHTLPPKRLTPLKSDQQIDELLKSPGPKNYEGLRHQLMHTEGGHEDDGDSKEGDLPQKTISQVLPDYFQRKDYLDRKIWENIQKDYGDATTSTEKGKEKRYDVDSNNQLLLTELILKKNLHIHLSVRDEAKDSAQKINKFIKMSNIERDEMISAVKERIAAELSDPARLSPIRKEYFETLLTILSVPAPAAEKKD